MFLWIDPPGADPGWIHELGEGEQPWQIADKYPIPADNAGRQAAYDAANEGVPVQQYQAGRDHWGITALTVLPADLPAGVVMVERGAP
jgi:hypothetical protein